MMPSEIASIDAATGGKEAEISKLTALSGGYEIVLSNPKSGLPNFHLSDTLSKSSFGWHYEDRIPFPFLLPSHLRGGINGLELAKINLYGECVYGF